MAEIPQCDERTRKILERWSEDAINVGTDGGSLVDHNITLQYALQVRDETHSPVVVVPCVVEGEPHWFVSGYQASESTTRQVLASTNQNVRESVAVALCMLGHADARKFSDAEE